MRLRLMGGTPTEPTWLYGLAGALMLGGPIGRELYFTHYPARPEAFILPLIVGAIGAVVAIVSRVAGGLLGAIVFGALLFVFADIQFNPERFTYTAAVLGACIVLAFVLARHRAAIVVAGLSAFLLSSVVRPDTSSGTRSAAAPGRSGGPALVHVILDEQWGIGGLRAAGDSVTADFMTKFYLDRGFEVFEAAYSRYDITAASLPIAFSLGQPPSFKPSRSTPLGGKFRKSMRRIPYFERLRELGYELRVHESTYIDFCTGAQAPVATCDVQQANSIANIGFIGGSWITRAKLTGEYFVATHSHVYTRLRGEPPNCCAAVSGGGLAVLQRVTSDIAAGQSGATAYFVHVLVPHRPVQMDDQCRVLPADRQVGYAYGEHRSDSVWHAAVTAYGDQVRCAHRILGRVIDAIDSTVGRDNAIVIVHGDHGSRMHPHAPVRDSLQSFTVDELNSMFSTLFAIRRPHVAPALHRDPIPIQDAIWGLARSGFKDSLPGPWQHELRSNPDSLHEGFVRPLTPADMIWVRHM